MNPQVRQNRQAIRSFMRLNYSDERLAMLLAHTQSGRLDFTSCCCFIGIATADHALQGEGEFLSFDHTNLARMLPLGGAAELAFLSLADELPEGTTEERNVVRRRRLIPIIKAEIRRRDRERQLTASLVERASTRTVGT